MDCSRARSSPTAADVLRRLAETLDVGAVLRDVPGLTPEALRTLLTEAAAAAGEGRPPPSGGPGEAPGPRSAPGRPAAPVRMHVDGAARGNPGEAGAGVVFYGPDGRLLGKAGRYLGRATNNQAEYRALLLGLEIAESRGIRRLEVVADSELLVRQLEGRYRVREPRLKALHDEARTRMARFDRVTVRHTLRAGNAEADAMANAAIDRKLEGLADLVWYG